MLDGVLDEWLESRKLTGARRPRLGLRSLLGLALLLAIPLAGQSGFQQFPSGNGHPSRNYPDTSPPFGQDSNSPDQKRVRLLNAERQKQIISETEKLLKLAQELNDEVAASDSSSMSDEQLRKVAEIGKLAKSVKEKMSYNMGGFPALTPPLTTTPGVK